MGIAVSDNKGIWSECVEDRIKFATVNCEGAVRYWSVVDDKEFFKWWDRDDFDGPDGDDKVIDFICSGFVFVSQGKILNENALGKNEEFVFGELVQVIRFLSNVVRTEV